MVKRLFILVLCFCIILTVNAYALEVIDSENASIEELEAFISMAEKAESVLQEKKNHRTAEEMCELAMAEIKEIWANEKFMDDSDGYFQNVHTRVIYLYTESDDPAISENLKKHFTNDEGSPMTAIVECTLYTDYFSTAPYYVNVMLANCVAFYQDGTMEVCSKSPIEMYRARTFAMEFDGIIREIKDMGSQYNEVCYLK